MGHFSTTDVLIAVIPHLAIYLKGTRGPDQVYAEHQQMPGSFTIEMAPLIFQLG